MENLKATTIVCVRRGDNVVIAGDGQVTQGNVSVIKNNANKLRLLHKDSVIAGFAGATADAFTLFERFEAKLEQNNGQLLRSAVSFVKEWRTDKVLRPLQAMLLIADQTTSLLVTGAGDVMQPERDAIAIGSGGNFAQAAAIALLDNTDLNPEEIAVKSLTIAAEICVYTNKNINVLKLP